MTERQEPLSLPRDERSEALEGIAKTGHVPTLAELEALLRKQTQEPGRKVFMGRYA